MLFAAQSRRRSRLPIVLLIIAAFALAGWILAPNSHSQSPATSTNDAALTALITKIKEQQDQLAANQTKIEAQTAQLQEALRQAKIYSARGGSGHR